MPRFSIEDSPCSNEGASPLYPFGHNWTIPPYQQIDDYGFVSPCVSPCASPSVQDAGGHDYEEDRESVGEEENENQQIDDDGFGSPCVSPCASPSVQDAGGHDYEEDMESVGEEENENEGDEEEAEDRRGGKGNSGELRMRNVAGTSGPISVTLTHLDVLDCGICFEPFTIPVYQCENGHIGCSSCCTKLRNKCPSCCLPIGYNRCRAFEKVLESVKISCVNSEYGCKENVTYSKKHEHEQTCIYEPCSCPHWDCCFIGCYKDLYLHFSNDHPNSATQFKCGSFFSVPVSTNMRYMILQEHDNAIFILNYGVQSIGNVANITCIGPSSLQKEFSYELVASKEDSSVKLTSFAQSMPKWSVHLPQKSILLVPKDFIGSSRVHIMEVCIHKNVDKKLSN